MSLPVSSIIELIIGVTLMMIGIFRFTIYKERFNKPLNIAGLSIPAEFISVALFIIGLVMILLFLVNNLQPLFYQGRDKHPGLTYFINYMMKARVKTVS